MKEIDLDVYVTNGPSTPKSLYSNQLVETGQTVFVDVAAAAGVTATSQDSSGVCFGDIDHDGYLDLIVGNTYDDWGHRRPVFINFEYEGLASTTCSTGTTATTRSATSAPSPASTRSRT